MTAGHNGHRTQHVENNMVYRSEMWVCDMSACGCAVVVVFERACKPLL